MLHVVKVMIDVFGRVPNHLVGFELKPVSRISDNKRIWNLIGLVPGPMCKSVPMLTGRLAAIESGFGKCEIVRV